MVGLPQLLIWTDIRQNIHLQKGRIEGNPANRISGTFELSQLQILVVFISY